MQPIVSIQNLSKTYPNGHQALAGIDLDIAPGEIFALLGPNGAGKTTLIGSVCGLVGIQHGAIHVGGHDVARAPTVRELIAGPVLRCRRSRKPGPVPGLFRLLLLLRQRGPGAGA